MFVPYTLAFHPCFLVCRLLCTSTMPSLKGQRQAGKETSIFFFFFFFSFPSCKLVETAFHYGGTSSLSSLPLFFFLLFAHSVAAMQKEKEGEKAKKPPFRSQRARLPRANGQGRKIANTKKMGKKKFAQRENLLAETIIVAERKRKRLFFSIKTFLLSSNFCSFLFIRPRRRSVAALFANVGSPSLPPSSPKSPWRVT